MFIDNKNEHFKGHLVTTLSAIFTKNAHFKTNPPRNHTSSNKRSCIARYSFMSRIMIMFVQYN
ncbi:hypothetical protein DEO72_LG10g2362 [Vigna unguiculata]|uniref:Uncharacterized protein n=1 Tax=Vigna unguiculata TaxID=3917 RepID=A0A4D6NF17_VIGUN|nr:hypothetical protein DEO72_LG10g2362 [Vigna unguiculata]